MSRSQLLENDGFNQLAAGRDGYLLYNRNDKYIGRSIEKYGEFNGLEMQLFKQICTRDSIVVEVGANIGAHTIGLARLVGPQGRVLAFEPQRLVFQTLCANVALNSLENVDCHWAAVGSQEGFSRRAGYQSALGLQLRGRHVARDEATCTGSTGTLPYPGPTQYAEGGLCQDRC